MKTLLTQINLNIKSITNNKSSILFSIIIIVIALSLPIVFIWFWASAGLVYTIPILCITGVYFSTLHYETRNSTLYKNITLTKSNKWTFNLSVMITLLLVGFVISIGLFFALVIINKFDLLLVDLLKYSSRDSIEGNSYYVISFKILPLVTLYSVAMSLLTFSISFFACYFISNRRTYLIIIVSIAIITMIFGGALNDYFDVVGNEDNNVYLLDDGWSLFPNDFYWFSWLIPTFGSGQIISEAYESTKTVFENGSWSTATNWHTTNTSIIWEIIFDPNNDHRWKILVWTPFIQSLFYLCGGVILSKIIRR